MARKVLLTGANGKIGNYLTKAWLGKYDLLLSDRSPLELEEAKGTPFFEADLEDFSAVEAMCRGVDTIVHMGANASTEATWEELLPSNIIGAYNIFEAARQARVRRVIFASSIHAVHGYPEDEQVHEDMPTKPSNLYGASKVWGEALASLYAEQYKALSAIAIRIGWVVSRDNPQINMEEASLNIAITYRDLERLVRLCIEAPDDLRFAIFHGVSENQFKRMDIGDAREILDYEPQDDAFAIAMERFKARSGQAQ